MLIHVSAEDSVEMSRLTFSEKENKNNDVVCYEFKLLCTLAVTVSPHDVFNFVRLVIWRLRVQPSPGQQRSIMESDNKIFSLVILSLPLIQEVSGQRMHVRNTV